MTRTFLLIAAVSGFTGVALGAFAAHLLKEKLSPDLFSIFEVGVRYQMYHTLALIGIAWAMTIPGLEDLRISGWMFVVGILIFSGSLYVLSLTGARWMGMITPIGGLCFLAGWFWLFWCVWRSS